MINDCETYDKEKILSIIGKRYGRLTISKYLYNKYGNDGRLHHYYEAICDCGNTCTVKREGLLNGATKSCGCIKKEAISKSRRKNIIGQRFDRLVVLEYDHTNDSRDLFYKCKCDCGNICIVSGSNLIRGHTRSCGCLSKELKIERNKIVNKTHGLSKTKIYKKWVAMIARCYNPDNSNYPNYGARGITVCREWFNPDTYGIGVQHDNPEFLAFMKWSYENGYFDYDADKLPRSKWPTLDRKDVNGPYAPWNCQYVTGKAQQNNLRTNRIIYDTDGSKLTFTQLSTKYTDYKYYVSSKMCKSWSRDAVVYAIHHLDDKIHTHNGLYRDKDNFPVLIPRIDPRNDELDKIEGRDTLEG